MTGRDNDTVSSVLKEGIFGGVGGGGGSERGGAEGLGGTLHGDKGQFIGGCCKRGGCGGGSGKTAEWLLGLIWTPGGDGSPSDNSTAHVHTIPSATCGPAFNLFRSQRSSNDTTQLGFFIEATYQHLYFILEYSGAAAATARAAAALKIAKFSPLFTATC